MHKSFAAARRVDKGEVLTFDLNGQNFTCLTDLPGGMLLDWTEKAADPKITELEQAQFAAQFLEDVLDDESAVRFNEGLHSKTDPITADQMGDVLNWLVEVYMGRPTEPALPSAPGQSNTGRTSTAPVSKAKSNPSRSVRTAS